MRKNVFKRLAALILAALFALCLLTGCAAGVKPEPSATGEPERTALPTTEPSPTAAPVTKADYVAAKPKDRQALTRQERFESAERAGNISAFTERLMKELLNENEGENIALSPVNIYIALAMLSETVGGSTREEILSALGVSDAAALREQVRAIIDAESVEGEDERTMCRIADSLWLNNAYPFNTDVLETLADSYDASSFWGDPSDAGFSDALRGWLNENTGGLLKDSVKNIELDPATVIALCSTVWYKAMWNNLYTESANTVETFRGADGNTECTFMHKSNMNIAYHMGEGFVAVKDSFAGLGGVWYLLPDEGVSVEDMLLNGGMDFILSDKSENVRYDSLVRYTVPKYDLRADINLVGMLRKLGVKSCFDPASADFSPLTAADGLYVSEVKHSARIKADEDGIEAAAYTIELVCGAAEPTELVEIDLTLDRPFVLVITGVTGLPLFIGAVNSMNN